MAHNYYHKFNHSKTMERVFCMILFFVSVYCLCYSIPDCYAEESTPSLFGYSGYLSTPSAYVVDGTWGFHYSDLPNAFGPFHKGKSENLVFTSTLCLFPFLECYFSVFVSPDYEWKLSGRGDTTRSPGIKIQAVKEKLYIPAVAFGLYDPYLEDGKLDYNDVSSPTVSSTFIVFSKKLSRHSISLGYGFDAFHDTEPHLTGFFGGIDIVLSRFVSLIADYDGETVSEGIYAHWRNYNISLAYVGEKTLAYRIGYNINLLK